MKPTSFIASAIIACSALGGAACATADDAPAPPPPPSSYEFWTPVDREHVAKATCASSAASIEWSYQSGQSEIKSLTFNSQNLSDEVLQELNDHSSVIDGDFHVLLDCSDTLIRIVFLQSNTRAGNERASVQVVLNSDNILQVKTFNIREEAD